jgi:site-specific DNA recombinase
MLGKASGTARYRIVVAETRGAKVKKKLEIAPLHADIVRLIFHLALDGDGGSAPMGVKAIVNHLNARRIFTRDGGRWGIGQVHRILTRCTYIGERVQQAHQGEGAEAAERGRDGRGAAAHRPRHFRFRPRNPKVMPARVVSGPTLLTGSCYCAIAAVP